MNEKSKRISRLSSGKPIGKQLTEVGNGHYRDEVGRIFKADAVEDIARKKRYGQYMRDKRHFTFTHMEHIREVTETMTNKQCGYVLMLQPYIQYQTNMISKPGRIPEPMNDKQIAEVFGVQVRTCRTVLVELEAADIIEKVDDKHYRINERYHFRKKAEVDVDMLVKTFQTAVKQLDLKPADMGVVYKLLPYVHYESNLVCENPFEDKVKEVKILNKSQIADKVGMSRQKFDDTLKKLTASGVVAEVKRKASFVPNTEGDGRETVVLINPSIITRMKGEPDTTLKHIFGL